MDTTPAQPLQPPAQAPGGIDELFRLRALLFPLAALEIDDAWPDSKILCGRTAGDWIDVGHVRRARAALNAQPTAPATGYPAYPLRGTQAACPVCDRPGWVIDLRGGGTVTLHSEQSTADGHPIIDDACWTSE